MWALDYSCLKIDYDIWLLEVGSLRGMTNSDEHSMYKKGFMLIPEESLGPCENCGDGTIIKFCKKYDGYIGKCTACDAAWRESWW